MSCNEGRRERRGEGKEAEVSRLDEVDGSESEENVDGSKIESALIRSRGDSPGQRLQAWELYSKFFL